MNRVEVFAQSDTHSELWHRFNVPTTVCIWNVTGAMH